ncbi:hypothetical protein AB1Y20_004160 [Prymnesium parvum]|uniref:Biogenesis of lysosome-related organelles complex 1 subunit 5 n=1 Tax=Prymnesium parvum TaxID=97485 RepID=A0AB34J727_PRYPA
MAEEAALEALDQRFASALQTIRTRNEAICERALAVRADVRRTSDRCHALSAGWQRLRDELLLLPATTHSLRELPARTAELFGRVEELEDRLTELSVLRVRQREREWRRRREAEVERLEAAKRREALHLEAVIAEQAARERRRELEERRDVFDEEFEAQRRYVLEHGKEELVRVAAKQQEQPGPHSLAEVEPGPFVDDAELDDFYNVEVVPLDEGPQEDS